MPALQPAILPPAGAGEPACAPAAGPLAAAQTLELREAQLRGILAAAHEAIITADESQTIVMANRAATDMFGYRATGLVGMPLGRLLPERFRAPHHAQVAGFGASAAPARPMGRRREVVALRADGEEFPVDAAISQANVGGARLYTVILRDLTEARRSAAALRTSERMRAATFNVSSVGMAHVDPASKRFVEVNDAFCRICGYSDAELREMEIDRLEHPDDRLDALKFDALLRGTAGYEVQTRLVRKDGSVAWVQVSGSVVRDADGRPVIVVGVVQDVTARRQVQQALAAREARQSFLVRLNDGLRWLDDPQQIGFEASRMLAEFVGASRVGLAEDDGNGETITVARHFTAGVPGIGGRYRYADYGAALRAELRAGRTVVRPDIANDPSLTAEDKAAHAALLLGAAVCVPLRKGQKLVAVFFVHATTARAWTPDEVALFEDVAERIRADIERARAEAALRTREAQLRLFVDHAPVALAMFDREMRYLAASRRWLDDYGLQAPVLGRSHYDVFPEIGPRWREVHRRCLGGASERCDDDRFERADGRVQWLRWEALPWYAGSDVGGIVIFTEDVTERKHAQLALEQSEERFRATFEQAAVGIAHLSPDGRWLRVNRRLCEIVGRDRDELLLRPFEDITHPDDIGADRVPRRRLAAGEIDHFALDKRYLRKDGDPFWVRVTVSARRRDDGSPDYFIAVIEDIDERRRTEDAFRRLRGEMEQMLTLNVATQTAAAIAHELNQPLNAVASYAEAAQRLFKAGNPKPERLVHALQAATEQAQRAGRVVRELMEFLHRGETATETVDLNDVVREALAIVESNGFGGFAAEVDLAAGLRPVQANRMQVEKVLVNLLRNSVEAMRGIGIAMRAIRITVTTADQEDTALVTVQDQGPGLNAASAQHVFQPFFSTKAGGIGMGLAVSRALVEANGGQLWYDAAVGPGATFRFTLPFVR